MSDEPDHPNQTIDRLITRALGEELKKARQNAGLSQADVVARMSSKLHPQTLASYEQGARQCTVVRLCEIARPLDVSPTDLLAKALSHAQVDAQSVSMHVDLCALADNKRSDLKALRRWARARLASYPDSTLARLDGSVVREMAVMFGVTAIELLDLLGMFSPETVAHRVTSTDTRTAP